MLGFVTGHVVWITYTFVTSDNKRTARKLLENYTNFHETPSNGIQVVPCEQRDRQTDRMTDRCNDAYIRFAILRKRLQT